jgi:hypothetical protein
VSDTSNNGNASRSGANTGHGASLNDKSTSTCLKTSSTCYGLQSPDLSSYTTTPPTNGSAQAVTAKVDTVSAVREALLLSLPSASDICVLLRNTKNNSAFCSQNHTRNRCASDEPLGETVPAPSLLNAHSRSTPCTTCAADASARNLPATDFAQDCVTRPQQASSGYHTRTCRVGNYVGEQQRRISRNTVRP